MAETAGVGTWSTDGWRAEAIAWIDHQLASAGIARTGVIEQPRIRPWATVMTVPTAHGRFWFKAAAPETAFEVALYPLLHRRVPHAVLPPLAVDTERGWLLLPDGGTYLRDIAEGEELVDAMATVLPRYAELQRTLAPDAEAMIALGVPDMRPATMLRRFDEALEATSGWVTRSGTDEDRAVWEQITHARSSVEAWCQRLAESPVPASLEHDDLHGSNILLRGGEVGSARFYDWGDSVVAHPFTSLLVTLRSVQAHLEVDPEHPALLRLRDAYLAAFSDFGSHAELVKTLEIACHLGKIIRSLVWERALGLMPDDEAGEFAGAPLYWLAEILDDSYLGSLMY